MATFILDFYTYIYVVEYWNIKNKFVNIFCQPEVNKCIFENEFKKKLKRYQYRLYLKIPKYVIYIVPEQYIRKIYYTK